MSTVSTKPRKKILLVTYVFPPYAAVGVYRILKFCKFLPEFGYDPVILTPKDPNVLGLDDGLMDQVDEKIPVYRTPSWEPFRAKREQPASSSVPSSSSEAGGSKRPNPLAPLKQLIKANLSVPDTSLLWGLSGFNMGRAAINDEGVDIVLSSSPPQSVHLLGHRLARSTGRPLIADFRDLWTQNTSYRERNLPGYLHRRNRSFEQKVLRESSGLSVNTETFKQQLLGNNPFLDPDQVMVVNNGVDPDDFREMLNSSSPNERFTILYTGSLYGDHRNPEFFFQALRQWLDRNPEIGEHINVKFIGNWTDKHHGIIERFKLGSVVEKLGWMPQRKVLAETFAADLLLLIQGFDPVLSAALPRKLYEYMITNKPVLAFAPAGEIPEVMQRYNCGVCLSSADPNPIIESLDAQFRTWQAAREVAGVDTVGLREMPDLETMGQVEKLAQFCDRIIQEK